MVSKPHRFSAMCSETNHGSTWAIYHLKWKKSPPPKKKKKKKKKRLIIIIIINNNNKIYNKALVKCWF